MGRKRTKRRGAEDAEKRAGGYRRPDSPVIGVSVFHRKIEKKIGGSKNSENAARKASGAKILILLGCERSRVGCRPYDLARILRFAQDDRNPLGKRLEITKIA